MDKINILNKVGLLTSEDRKQPLTHGCEYFTFRTCVDLSQPIQVIPYGLSNEFSVSQYSQDIASFICWWTKSVHKDLNGFSGFSHVQFVPVGFVIRDENTPGIKGAEILQSLYRLAQVLNDSVEGYEKLLLDTEDKGWQDDFRTFALNSRSYRSELTVVIRKFNGNPPMGSSTTGKLYRAWMDVKSASHVKDMKGLYQAILWERDATIEIYGSVLPLLVHKSELHALVQKQRDDMIRLKEAFIQHRTSQPNPLRN